MQPHKILENLEKHTFSLQDTQLGRLEAQLKTGFECYLVNIAKYAAT